MKQWLQNFEANYLNTGPRIMGFAFVFGVLSGHIRYFIKYEISQTWQDYLWMIGDCLAVTFVAFLIFDRFVKGVWNRQNALKIGIVIVGGIIAVPIFIIVFSTLLPLLVDGHL